MSTTKCPEGADCQNLVEAGKRSLADGDNAAAFETLRTAVQANPKDLDAVTNYGRAALRVGRVTEAKDALTRAVHLDPDNAQVCREWRSPASMRVISRASRKLLNV